MFEWVLTMLSTGIDLDVVPVAPLEPSANPGNGTLDKDRQWAEQLGRTLRVLATKPQEGPEIVRMLAADGYDAVVLPAPSASWKPLATDSNWLSYVAQHAPCSVFTAIHPAIPRVVVA